MSHQNLYASRPKPYNYEQLFGVTASIENGSIVYRLMNAACIITSGGEIIPMENSHLASISEFPAIFNNRVLVVSDNRIFCSTDFIVWQDIEHPVIPMVIGKSGYSHGSMTFANPSFTRVLGNIVLWVPNIPRTALLPYLFSKDGGETWGEIQCDVYDNVDRIIESNTHVIHINYINYNDIVLPVDGDNAVAFNKVTKAVKLVNIRTPINIDPTPPKTLINDQKLVNVLKIGNEIISFSSNSKIHRLTNNAYFKEVELPKQKFNIVPWSVVQTDSGVWAFARDQDEDISSYYVVFSEDGFNYEVKLIRSGDAHVQKGLYVSGEYLYIMAHGDKSNTVDIFKIENDNLYQHCTTELSHDF